MLDVVASRSLVDSLPLTSDQLTEAMVRKFLDRILPMSLRTFCVEIHTVTAVQAAFVNVLSPTHVWYDVSCLALVLSEHVGREGAIFLF